MPATTAAPIIAGPTDGTRTRVASVPIASTASTGAPSSAERARAAVAGDERERGHARSGKQHHVLDGRGEGERERRRGQGAAPTLASALAAPSATNFRRMRFSIVTSATNKAGPTAIVAVRMAIVSPPRPRRSALTIPTILEERRRRVPAVVAPIVTIVGIAVAMFVVYGPWFVNYDARYALLWARDLWHGLTPEYTGRFAPTPHPLETAVSSRRAAVRRRRRPMHAVGHAAVASARWCGSTYRLGAELFSPVGRRRRRARRADAAGDRARRADRLPGPAVRGARDRRGAAGGAAAHGAASPSWSCSRSPGCCARRRGCWRASTGCTCGAARATRERLRTLALVARRAADLGRLATGSSPATRCTPCTAPPTSAEAADRRRDPPGRARTGRPSTSATRCASRWCSACRSASRSRGSTRAGARVLPFVVVVAMTAVFAIGPLFGLPLIAPLRRDPGRAADALLRARRRRLADAPAEARAAAAGWWPAAFAALLSVVYMPWHVTKLDERRPPGGPQDGVMYARPARVGEAPAVRAAFDALRAARRRRPPPDPVSPLLARRCARLGRARSRAAAPGRQLLLLPRRNRATKRVYSHETFPNVAAARGLPADLPQRLVARVRRAGVCCRRARSTAALRDGGPRHASSVEREVVQAQAEELHDSTETRPITSPPYPAAVRRRREDRLRIRCLPS